MRLFERMPQLDGTSRFIEVRKQDSENTGDFQDYCNRRKAQDADVWIVELDIADAERFIV